jgi:hypothetical protein
MTVRVRVIVVVMALVMAPNELRQAYERPADAFLSGSMSDCVEKGFVR